MVNSPLIRPYLLGGWHWGGTLRLPWYKVCFFTSHKFWWQLTIYFLTYHEPPRSRGSQSPGRGVSRSCCTACSFGGFRGVCLVSTNYVCFCKMLGSNLTRTTQTRQMHATFKHLECYNFSVLLSVALWLPKRWLCCDSCSTSFKTETMLLVFVQLKRLLCYSKWLIFLNKTLEYHCLFALIQVMLILMLLVPLDNSPKRTVQCDVLLIYKPSCYSVEIYLANFKEFLRTIASLILVVQYHAFHTHGCHKSSSTFCNWTKVYE